MVTHHSRIEDDVNIKFQNGYNKLLDLLSNSVIRNIKWELSRDIYFHVIQNIRTQLQEDLQKEI